MYLAEGIDAVKQSDYMEAVTIGLTMGTTFPITIASTPQTTLVDTGDSCSHMSE